MSSLVKISESLSFHFSRGAPLIFAGVAPGVADAVVAVLSVLTSGFSTGDFFIFSRKVVSLVVLKTGLLAAGLLFSLANKSSQVRL